MTNENEVHTTHGANQKIKEFKLAISIKVDQLDRNYTSEGQRELDKLLEQHVHWTNVRNDLKSRGL